MAVSGGSGWASAYIYFTVPDGYVWLAYVMPMTSGWTGAIYVDTNASTGTQCRVWYEQGAGTIYVTGLYIKDGLLISA